MDLIIATGNEHKKKEIAQILYNHKLLLPEEAGYTFQYEELGTTYFENAYGKAHHLYTLAEKPILADDSGLNVPALQGNPGIHSARYGSDKAGRTLEPHERNELLLRNMRDISDRRAFFVCCTVLLLAEYRFMVAQETVQGEITLEPRGGGGFGYDPIFLLPDGRTMAQLSDLEKNRISHRGKSIERIRNLLETEKTAG